MFSFLRKKDHATDSASEVDPLNISPTIDMAPSEESNLFDRLKQRLSRSSSKLTDGFASLILGKKIIDDNLLEELENQLLSADIGIDATQSIIVNLTQRMRRNQLGNSDMLFNALRDDMIDILRPSEKALLIPEQTQPYVILMVGINGVGKTTTIGKLAKQFQSEGKSVMLAAGDTFRAAAIEQLQVWGERNNIPVIAQQPGADSASVIFDGLQAAKARNIDVLIADTAGRLLDAHAPQEVMLVLDAGTGQNALNQATQFQEVVDVTGITITKLDGTAKGGIIFAIAKKLELPIRYIGVGEAIDDLRPFKATEFVDALLGREN